MLILTGIRSKQFAAAWENLPLTDKLIWIYFLFNTLGIITLIEIIFFK